MSFGSYAGELGEGYDIVDVLAALQDDLEHFVIGRALVNKHCRSQHYDLTC